MGERKLNVMPMFLQLNCLIPAGVLDLRGE